MNKAIDPIGFLKKNATENGDSVFLQDAVSGRTMTFGELHKCASCFCESARGHKLIKGDRIALMLPNSFSFVKLYFGCLYSGIVTVPVNPLLSNEQKKYIINHSRASYVVVDESTLPDLNDDNIGAKILVLSDKKGVVLDGEEIFFDLNAEHVVQEFDFSTLCPEDILTIVFTSGTTADPKGVVHSLKNLFINAHVFCTEMGIGREHIFYNNLAMTYLGGYYNLLLLPFVAESKVILGKTFSAESVLNFWGPIIEHGVNTLWFVPTLVSILNDFDRGDAGINYCKSSMKLALIGTAPLPVEARKKFEGKYGIKLYENFGLSETLFISTQSHRQSTENSVGNILPCVKTQITGKDDRPVTENESGEIEVQSDTLMLGYFDVEKNAPILPLEKGWFKTGDLGFQTGQSLYITGRKKDLIIRGGINISPLSIENIIYQHPSVSECAVVGIPHPIMGEEIIVVVKPAGDSDFNLIKSELERLCNNLLSPVQRPSRYAELDDFPYSSTSKILKGKIRSWLIEKFSKIAPGENKPAHSKEKIDFFQPSKIVSESIEAMSIHFNNRVYEMQKSGEDVTVLSLGEAFFDIPLYPFSDLPLNKIYHYSHSRGIIELRECIAKYFMDQYDVEFDPDTEIIVTAGSKIGIHMALMALLNPGDEVIIYEPAWVSYPEQIKLCSGIPVRVSLYESVFDFEKYITNRTKVIIINNPNNPSGKVFSIEELSYLNNLARKYKLFILSDEAYSEFVQDGDKFVSLGNLDPEKTHSIIVNSISKNFGISGWRLGYVITNKNFINQLLKVNQHLITCPATILEYYIAKHFGDIIKITKPQIQAVIEKRKQIAEYLNKIGIQTLEGSATFYLFASIAPSLLGSVDFCNRLLGEEKISAVPGIGYGDSCDSYIRISTGTESMERTLKAMDVIKQLIISTGR